MRSHYVATDQAIVELMGELRDDDPASAPITLDELAGSLARPYAAVEAAVERLLDLGLVAGGEIGETVYYQLTKPEQTRLF